MKYADLKYKNGDRVLVSRLGEDTPGSWPAIIRGCAVKDTIEYCVLWIVEWENRGIPEYIGDLDVEDYPFDCSVIPQACIDPA